MILLLRGHIRNSFDNDNLYNLIVEMQKSLGDFHIYIHTWSIFQSNISWRAMETNNRPVTTDTIYQYFRNMSYLIKHIMIEDDNNIILHGNIEGKLGNTLAPLKGWKNYWCGVHNILNFMNNTIDDKNTVVFNTRFDILNNFIPFSVHDIISFIQRNRYEYFSKNVFLNDIQILGIDNMYLGTIFTQFCLAQHFYYNLDNILLNNPGIIHQEELARIENNKIFG